MISMAVWLELNSINITCFQKLTGPLKTLPKFAYISVSFSASFPAHVTIVASVEVNSLAHVLYQATSSQYLHAWSSYHRLSWDNFKWYGLSQISHSTVEANGICWLWGTVHLHCPPFLCRGGGVELRIHSVAPPPITPQQSSPPNFPPASDPPLFINI